LPLPNLFLSAWASDAARTRIYCHKRQAEHGVHSSEQFIAGTSRIGAAANGPLPAKETNNFISQPFTADVGGQVDWTQIIAGLIGIRPPELAVRVFDFPDFGAIFRKVMLARKDYVETEAGKQSAQFWKRRLKSMANRFGPLTPHADSTPVATVFCQQFIHVSFSRPLLHTSNCPVAAMGHIPGRFVFAMADSPSTALLSLPRTGDLALFSAMPERMQADFINFFTLACASVAFDFGMNNLDFIGRHLGWAGMVQNHHCKTFLDTQLTRILLTQAGSADAPAVVPSPHFPSAKPARKDFPAIVSSKRAFT